MNLKMFDLTGKVAMVTGSSKGLGEVAAVALAKAGADVAVCGRNRADIDRVVERLKKMGSNTAGFVLEVTSGKTVQEGVSAILEHFRQIDILINNAGTNYRVPVLEFPEEEWDRVIDTNLKGYYLVTRAVVPQMIEHGGGKVINMSSILSMIALPNQLAYASAKGGVRQMTKIMALEWAKKGVQVNAIAPTYFETEMVLEIKKDKERLNFINQRTPMGRWGKLEEMEGIVIFLASAASNFITGQSIAIDGGWTIG
ncbi:gluconate 5-dehydrogenase Gno [Desulfotignum phosphitoxidans DSM 13687]|uniref:Gluconate 5-dehydrogenase Gno n=2 Tax=Desulfotignum phosphitoxidans TaxID=190898 RepID=S0G552_9BACT|nr:gluconate 5-dehydrogenase Gno [Desulfotignum phosphitoxidans DSM 13687]